MKEEPHGIVSITRGPRQSNFELLRIIAMVMVLGLHLNFKYSGVPSGIELKDNFGVGCFSILMECLCLPAVSVFILISGWFTIQPKCKGLLSFVYQSVFFLTGTYLVFVVITHSRISLEGIASCFALTGNSWFIVTYLILYILSPLLNQFVNNGDKSQNRIFLISFFFLSIVYGWIGGNINYNNGYSVLSFIGLYVLGRYLRLFCQDKHIEWRVILIVSVIINAALIFIDILYYDSVGLYRILAYTNPLIIIQAVSLIMLFSKLSIKTNPCINFIARSSFSVYLLHDCSKYETYFISTIVENLRAHYTGVFYISSIIGLIVIIYITAIMLDQLRILSWDLFYNKLRSLFRGWKPY